MDFGMHSEQMNPELYLQGLIEGHLLLRSKVIQQKPQCEDEHTQELYKMSCRLLGEFYARKSSTDCLLTLPYFKMAGLSLEEVYKFCHSDSKEGPSLHNDEAMSRGLLYYLEDAVFQEKACVSASQECLSTVLDIMLKHQPGLCSEILVASHLQGKFDLEKADQVLVKLKKRVIQGQTYQWKTLDFIAAIKIYLAKGEVEQAMATFDLIYEDELVGLCSRREDLIVTKNKEQLTYLAEMMIRFPSAIVSIMVNLTESGRLTFKDVCKLLEKRTTETSGNNSIFTQYLEAILASSSDVCKTSHTEALERLAHLYINHLISENTTPTLSSKRKPSNTSRSTRLQQKKKSRHSWLDKLPPFEGSNISECIKLPQAMSPPLKNQGMMWRFTVGKTGPRTGSPSSHTCNCLDCQASLVQLQEILCKKGIEAINIHEVMEKCKQVSSENGRASLELLCLAVSSFEEAVRKFLEQFPSVLCEFAISVTSHSDWNRWKLIIYEVHKKLQGLEDKDRKVYQQCMKDILHHLSSNLSPDDFQAILPPEIGTAISKPYLEKVYKVQKIRILRADITSSLEVLVK
ncbi:Hermansky-Pudlak syndrome 3 protein-like [Holothuria leucospilota]|uniref:Hermansky-Pudlak syndrome 3 protein-like n=1 Tax=Holothuria leucospilota TaxID=206669 RepID=A0A9Q0YHA7_HOLLE|nr:Hermansky-Pudlak syndrome 3 protein-like [Holothuria leucospilota]